MAPKQTYFCPPRTSMINPEVGETTMEKMAMMPAVCPASTSPIPYVTMSQSGPKARKV